VSILLSAGVEIVAPRRFGAGFRWLVASSWVSNLGDGIALAAGPLLVASMTHDPILVALAALLQWLPPLIFGLYAGALADRLDRRLIIVTVDLLRALVLVLLTAAIAIDVASIWLVLVAMFLLGTAEVFADNTSATLMPMLVQRDDLAIANARSRPASSRSTSWPDRRSGRRSSPSATRCRSRRRRSWSRSARC
jgi:MFS family permease